MGSDITVLVFGPLRERIGVPELHATGETVAAVWDSVARRHGLGAVPDGVRAARNLEYCAWDAPVSPGDVVAFLPPVAGGSGADVDDRVEVALTASPIDVAAATDIAGDADGAVAVFIGRVRDHSDSHHVTRVEYEAYAPMAESETRRIASVLVADGGISRIRITQRTGSLAIGEPSIVIAVAGPHRAAALAACAAAIDMVKQSVPIWKREHRDDGAHWVDARHGDGDASHQ